MSCLSCHLCFFKTITFTVKKQKTATIYVTCLYKIYHILHTKSLQSGNDNTSMEIKKCFYSIIRVVQKLYTFTGDALSDSGCRWFTLSSQVSITCEVKVSHKDKRSSAQAAYTTQHPPSSFLSVCVSSLLSHIQVLINSTLSLFVLHSVWILRYVVWLHRKWSHILHISCLSKPDYRQ